MPLRPFAPLAVIGAGLMIMVIAPHSASAEDAGPPLDVAVTPSGSDLLVTWQAPAAVAGLTDYDLTVTEAGTKQQLLHRSLATTAVQARISPADLGGSTDLVVALAADYGTDAHYAAGAVQVTLPDAPGKPESAPDVRVEGGVLTVRLPKTASSGEVTGRVVRLFRDDVEWLDLTVPSPRSTVKRKVAAGHDYAAAYQVLAPAAESPFSEQSDAIAVKTRTTGPTAVRTVTLKAVDGGLQVRWKAALPQGADVDSYRVRVSRDGERIGSAYTAAAVRSVVLAGGEAAAGLYSVTVTAKDSAGGTSSSTVTVQSKG